METKRIFGDNVRRLRKGMSLTQEQLAEMSGYHRTYIGTIEQRGTNASIKVLEKLADVFGVEPSDLLVDAGSRTRAASKTRHSNIPDKPLAESMEYAICHWDDDGVSIEPIEVTDEDLTIRTVCALILEGREDVAREYARIHEQVESIFGERYLQRSGAGNAKPEGADS